MMVKVVIFDMDGVIVDSVGFTVSTFLDILKMEGIEVEGDFIAARIGIGAKQVFRDILAFKKIQCKDAYLDELVGKLEKYQVENADKLPVFEGFLKLFNALGEFKRALGTMSTRAQADFKLQRAGVTFDTVNTMDDVSLPKPHPDIYLKCATDLGVDVSECVVIEDSFPGVQAAKNAGMKCIGVTTGYYDRKALEDAGADLVVSTLDDVEVVKGFIGYLN